MCLPVFCYISFAQTVSKYGDQRDRPITTRVVFTFPLTLIDWNYNALFSIIRTCYSIEQSLQCHCHGFTATKYVFASYSVKSGGFTSFWVPSTCFVNFKFRYFNDVVVVVINFGILDTWTDCVNKLGTWFDIVNVKHASIVLSKTKFVPYLSCFCFSVVSKTFFDHHLLLYPTLQTFENTVAQTVVVCPRRNWDLASL